MPGPLTVILPVYRCAAALPELHARLRQTLGAQAELLFIDDASPDAASAMLLSITTEDEHAAGLTLSQNCGQNTAVMVGLAAARTLPVIIMDADLQDPPEAIPSLLPVLQGQVHAVFAGRRGAYETRSRLLTSFGFKNLLHLASGRRLPVDAGLFVALDGAMRTYLLRSWQASPYILGMMARSKFQMRSIPVARAARPERTSAYTIGMRLRLAARALYIAFNLGPQHAQPPVQISAAYGRRFEHQNYPFFIPSQ